MKFDDLFNQLIEQSNPYAPVKSVTTKEEIPSGDQYKVKSVDKTPKPRRTAKGGAGAPPGLDIDKADKKMVARRGKGPGPKTLPPELKAAADKAVDNIVSDLGNVAAGPEKKKFGGGGSAGRRIQKEASVTLSLKGKDEPEIRDSKGNVVKPEGKPQEIKGLDAAVKQMMANRDKYSNIFDRRTGKFLTKDRVKDLTPPKDSKEYTKGGLKYMSLPKEPLGQSGAAKYDKDLLDKQKPTPDQLD